MLKIWELSSPVCPVPNRTAITISVSNDSIQVSQFNMSEYWIIHSTELNQVHTSRSEEVAKFSSWDK